LSFSDLALRRERFGLLPEGWRLPEFSADLDRVEGVIRRRVALVGAVSDAAVAVQRLSAADPFDVDAAVLARGRLWALQTLLEEQPEAVLRFELLLPAMADALQRLNVVLSSDTVPALAYANERAMYESVRNAPGVEPPVLTDADDAAMQAVEAARERFTAWAGSVQSLYTSAGNSDAVDWLSTAAQIIDEALTHQSDLEALRKQIDKANRLRRDRGRTWRGPRQVDFSRVVTPTLHLYPPVQQSAAAADLMMRSF
jgi:hypothetical protein